MRLKRLFRSILFFLAAITIVPACGGGGGGGGVIVVPPGAFALLSPCDTGTGLGTTVTFVWEPSPGATTYTLQVATDAAFTTLIVDLQSIPGEAAKPATVLANGTLYYWRVFAVNGSGFTASTGPGWTFTTAPPTGGPPGAFAMTTPANASIGVSVVPTFTWNASSGATSYVVQVATSVGFLSILTEKSGIAGTTHTLSTVLANSTTYYWRVIAVNGAGLTTATGAPWSFTTQAASGTPPGGFTLTDPSDTATGVSRTPTFQWNASSGANTYTVQVSTAPTFSTFVVNEANIGATNYSTVVTLNYLTLYYWRVIAVNAQGQTTATGAPWSFTTRPTPGSLDLSFGTGGKVTTDIGLMADQAYAVSIQPDQKLIVAGRAHNGSQNEFAVVRYNADGSLDTTFDTDGIVTTAIGSADDSAQSVALQADGKIVAAGYTNTGAQFDCAVVRYNSDGSLDTSFDTDGRVTTDPTGGVDIAWGVAIQADGKIIAATGGALVRYNADGSLDTTFDGDGIATQVQMTIFDVAIQTDGKIVVAGMGTSQLGTNTNFYAGRFNTDGSPDTSFDTDGFVDVPVHVTRDDRANGVAIQADGKIVLSGYQVEVNGFDRSFALVRCNVDGSLDTTFDGDGIAVTPIGSRADEANDVALQADGRIVAAGIFEQASTNLDFSAVRYDVTGPLDTTFDVDGKLTLFIGANDDEGHGVAIQADGKIVIAGFTDNGTDNDFALIRVWD